jgi:lipopolysaccharide export system permease protein
MVKVYKNIVAGLSLMDIYFIQQLIPPFLLFTLIAAIITELIGISFEQAKFVTERGLPLLTSFYIHYLKLPSFIAISFPFAALFTTVFTYASMSDSSEIVALQNCGVSLYRLLKPALIIGTMAAFIMFGCYEMIVPTSNYNTAMILEKHMGVDRNQLDKYNKRNIVYQEYQTLNRGWGDLSEEKRLIFAEKFNGKQLEEVIILIFYNQQLRTIINTRLAQWNQKQKIWELFQGNYGDIKNNGLFYNTTQFSQINLKMSQNLFDYVQLNRDNREMNLWQLNRKLEILKRTVDNQKILNLKVDIQERYATPFACISLALLGCAAGIYRHTKNTSKSTSFAFTVITIFICHTLKMMTISLALAGVIPIFLGVWLPNLVVIVGGALILKKKAY